MHIEKSSDKIFNFTFHNSNEVGIINPISDSNSKGRTIPRMIEQNQVNVWLIEYSIKQNILKFLMNLSYIFIYKGAKLNYC